MKETGGIRMKYVISKSDGSQMDPEGCYFVLKLNADGPHGEASRAAMRVYAEKIEGTLPTLATDIHSALDEIERPEHEPLWDPVRDPVWRHGGDRDPS